MFGWERPAAFFASRRKRSTNESSVVEDLDRHPAPELLVLGEVDVRHPAGAELPQDAVAPVEERVDQGVGDGHSANRPNSTADVRVPP
jgi:hypothetical protein